MTAQNARVKTFALSFRTFIFAFCIFPSREGILSFTVRSCQEIPLLERRRPDKSANYKNY